jgi:hypothetical protein
MDITTCPECGDETMSGGLALWSGIDGAVEIIRCGSDGCDWVTIEAELDAPVVVRHYAAA